MSTRRYFLLVEGHKTFSVEILIVSPSRRLICNLDIFSKLFHTSKHSPAWFYLFHFWSKRPIYSRCQIQEPTNCPPRMSISTLKEIVILWSFYSTPVPLVVHERLSMLFSPSNNCHTQNHHYSFPNTSFQSTVTILPLWPLPLEPRKSCQTINWKDVLGKE